MKELQLCCHPGGWQLGTRSATASDRSLARNVRAPGPLLQVCQQSFTCKLERRGRQKLRLLH